MIVILERTLTFTSLNNDLISWEQQSLPSNRHQSQSQGESINFTCPISALDSAPVKTQNLFSLDRVS